MDRKRIRHGGAEEDGGDDDDDTLLIAGFCLSFSLFLDAIGAD